MIKANVFRIKRYNFSVHCQLNLVFLYTPTIRNVLIKRRLGYMFYILLLNTNEMERKCSQTQSRQPAWWNVHFSYHIIWTEYILCLKFKVLLSPYCYSWYFLIAFFFIATALNYFSSLYHNWFQSVKNIWKRAREFLF